jgi:TonB-dependent starch-binding outer membrane protein SusC
METPEEVSRFIGGGNIGWTPWKTEHQSLQVNFIGGADLASYHDLLYAPPTLQVEQRVPNGLPGVSVSNVAQINYLNYSINLIHHYDGLSWLDATTAVGFERDRRSNENPVSIGYNLINGVNAPTVGTVQDNFFYRTEELDQSFYGQEQLITLNSRLTLTAGVTAERSTNDGDVAQFYYYPHYSGSYRIPQFVSFIDEIKVRAAYGQSGNLAPYGSKYTGFNQTLLSGANGVANNLNLGDNNIKPEAEQETELGADVTFFHSRAQFSATIYQKRLTSLLLQQGVAPSDGYQTEFINGGEFTNQGIELQLQSTPLQLRNGFTWVATTTFFRNYSVVNGLAGPPFPLGIGLSGESFLAPGRSVSEVVNPAILGSDGLPVQVGDNYPGFDMSLGNEFSWKGFRVYGLIDWSRGAYVDNLTDLYFDTGKQLYADSAYGAQRFGQFVTGGTPYLQGASYLKVRQLTGSYTLPTSVVSHIGFGRVTSARIDLSGYNLWGIYKYRGLDPEVNFSGAVNVGRGVDITPYPPARSFYLGLNLGL